MAMGSAKVLPTGEQKDWAMPSGEPWAQDWAKARGSVSAMDAEKETATDSVKAPAVVTESVSDSGSASE
jgi:hypothetical protein